MLLAAVVGSGIMGERLAAGNLALTLLANSIATGADLCSLILIFSPISGAHFNPAVTLAEGLLRHLGADRFEVASAGVSPTKVRTEAVQVMDEIGIDISQQFSKSVDRFTGSAFDYVITVWGHANEHCPVFPGRTQRVHWSFEDPALVEGDEATRLDAFRKVRDQISARLRMFVDTLTGLQD